MLPHRILGSNFEKLFLTEVVLCETNADLGSNIFSDNNASSVEQNVQKNLRRQLRSILFFAYLYRVCIGVVCTEYQ